MLNFNSRNWYQNTTYSTNRKYEVFKNLWNIYKDVYMATKNIYIKFPESLINIKLTLWLQVKIW